MSAEMTLDKNEWDDPLPEHETATQPQLGAAAAPAPDDWNADPSWDGGAAAATSGSGAVATEATPPTSAGSDAEKDKKKRKANLMIAGIAAALVGVVGTGVAVKMGRSKQAAEEYVPEPVVKAALAERVPRQPAPPAPIVAQPPTPQPDIQPAAEAPAARSDLTPSPIGAMAPAQAPAAVQPDPAASSSTDDAALRELKAKGSALEAANAELKGQLASLTERVVALESRGPTAAPSNEQARHKTNVAQYAKAKQQGKLAYDADVVRGKPGAGAVAKAEPEHASNWSSYHTVATYPATGKAEKAWVTNGKGLVVVTAGSEIDGVKVSRLAGTTVYLADGGKIGVK